MCWHRMVMCLEHQAQHVVTSLIETTHYHEAEPPSVWVWCVCYSDEWVGHSDGQSECRVYMLQWSVGRSFWWSVWVWCVYVTVVSGSVTSRRISCALLMVKNQREFTGTTTFLVPTRCHTDLHGVHCSSHQYVNLACIAALTMRVPSKVYCIPCWFWGALCGLWDCKKRPDQFTVRTSSWNVTNPGFGEQRRHMT